MTAHLELDEMLLLIAEASYNGVITEDVTYISTRIIETPDLDLSELE